MRTLKKASRFQRGVIGLFVPCAQDAQLVSEITRRKLCPKFPDRETRDKNATFGYGLL